MAVAPYRDNVPRAQKWVGDNIQDRATHNEVLLDLEVLDSRGLLAPFGDVVAEGSQHSDAFQRSSQRTGGPSEQRDMGLRATEAVGREQRRAGPEDHCHGAKVRLAVQGCLRRRSYLRQIKQLELLRELSSRVVVPPAVVFELGEGPAIGGDVPDPNGLNWIVAQASSGTVVLSLVTGLGRGETEVLALALERDETVIACQSKQHPRRRAKREGRRKALWSKLPLAFERARCATLRVPSGRPGR